MSSDLLLDTSFKYSFKDTVYTIEAGKVLQHSFANHILGEGQTGFVRQCDYPTNDDNGSIRFAVKVIPYSRDVAKDLKAGRLASKCPQLVRYFGAVLLDGDCQICMEMMDCNLRTFYETAHSLRENVEKIDEKTMLYIIYNTIIGLNYLYKHGIMHRDVKPQNILLRRNGDVKVCDYNITVQLENSCAHSFIGHTSYMAPERFTPSPPPLGTEIPVEQSESNESCGDAAIPASPELTRSGPAIVYSIRADVWSLGVTIAEVANGREWEPYQAAAITTLTTAIQHGPLPRIDAGRGYSPELLRVVECCVQRRAKDRPKYDELLRMPWLAAYDEEYGGGGGGEQRTAECIERIAAIIDASRGKHTTPSSTPRAASPQDESMTETG